MATTTSTLALRKPATTDSVNVATDLNTPYDTIDDQFQKGSDVASATSITVPDEGYFDITGTTTTAGFSTVNAGIMKMVQFDGALQLTHNSGSFNLPTGANITTAAGDRALFRSEGSGNWRCMWLQKASGAALKIADESIDSDAYVDASIDAAHLASSSVTTAKINADAVTAAKIADDVIDSEHYVDASIDAQHLASSSVTTAKLNADAVTNSKIADDVIDSEHYVDASIDAAHLASSSVTSAKINDNAVTLGKLSDGTQGGLLYYASGGTPTELAASTDGYFLKTQGASANPVWAASSSGPSQAVQSDIEGETNEDTYLPPDLVHFSPGVAKFYVKFDASAGVQGTAYNTTSVADNGTGDWTVTIGTDFSSADWACSCTIETGYTRSANIASSGGQAAGTLQVRSTDNNGTMSDGVYMHVAGFGDL
jgi:hypothetical protein